MSDVARLTALLASQAKPVCADLTPFEITSASGALLSK